MDKNNITKIIKALVNWLAKAKSYQESNEYKIIIRKNKVSTKKKIGTSSKNNKRKSKSGKRQRTSIVSTRYLLGYT